MGRSRPFDDALSFLHTAFSAALAYLDPVALVAASIIYAVRQLIDYWSKAERPELTRGDYEEWLVGILIGVLTRILLGGG